MSTTTTIDYIVNTNASIETYGCNTMTTTTKIKVNNNTINR